MLGHIPLMPINIQSSMRSATIATSSDCLLYHNYMYGRCWACCGSAVCFPGDVHLATKFAFLHADTHGRTVAQLGEEVTTRGMTDGVVVGDCWALQLVLCCEMPTKELEWQHAARLGTWLASSQVLHCVHQAQLSTDEAKWWEMEGHEKPRCTALVERLETRLLFGGYI